MTVTTGMNPQRYNLPVWWDTWNRERSTGAVFDFWVWWLSTKFNRFMMANRFRQQHMYFVEQLYFSTSSMTDLTCSFSGCRNKPFLSLNLIPSMEAVTHIPMIKECRVESRTTHPFLGAYNCTVVLCVSLWSQRVYSYTLQALSCNTR